MESSITETKKPKEFLVYQRRGGSGSTSGETSLNKKKEISSKSESSFAQKDGKLNWEIGEDGHYYACVLCEKGGRLICCDFCPATYHLGCLKSKIAPKGKWKCPQCEHEEDSKPLIDLLNEITAKKRASAKKLKKDSSEERPEI
ncbi:hypothetical protein L6164_018108 [Bauhinia variegata]|uniref:Uncharacterized protein n=1 Tax=Bauhinia variegata TaxID=167791 RepID=A0ACB9NAP5_BAUVA|nr:hypothetical protein L6164_018108 [Bauhinia variegata]